MLNEQKLSEDIKEAMKSKDVDRLSTLRLVKAAITSYQIERKQEALEEADILQILQKQAKQRRESIESFEKAGRTELADKEKRELSILESYLPEQLSPEKLQSILEEAIRQCGATSRKDAGKVMKEVMPKVKGKADGKAVNELLAKLLPA
ncbi:MAG: GatB/YqeY domain-containing protein [Candidatus Omnitrophota bacterium]|jgi:hypothetical protein